MKRLFAVAALLAAGLVQAGDHTLAGTAWQLVSIQSMDDAQGTTQVAQPDHFTLEFGRDGRAALRLDCNRGMGDYQVEPAKDGATGSLTFGPIAATRAMCPPPHLDERLVRDLAYVRSYLLKDGKLYLSLMADGGIYEWAPLTADGAAGAAGAEGGAAAEGGTSVDKTGAAADPDIVVKPIRFAKGKSSATIRGRVTGRQIIDYQLRAKAGQRMTVKLDVGNKATYFNLLPPGSNDVALAIGEQLDTPVLQGIAFVVAAPLAWWVGKRYSSQRKPGIKSGIR